MWDLLEAPPIPDANSRSALAGRPDVGVVFVLAGPSARMIERWVQEVSRLAGEPVDWGFYGGRAVVECCGSGAAVRAAIDVLLPALREAAARDYEAGGRSYEVTT